MEDAEDMCNVVFRMKRRKIAALDEDAQRAGLSRSELIRMRLEMPIEIDSGCRWYAKQMPDGRSRRFARDRDGTGSVPEKVPERTDSKASRNPEGTARGPFGDADKTESGSENVRFRTFSSKEEERKWRAKRAAETANARYLFAKILADGSLYDASETPERDPEGAARGPREGRDGSGSVPKKVPARTFSESDRGPEKPVKVLLTDAAWRDLKVELTRWGVNFNQGVRAINVVAKRLNSNAALRRNDVDEIVAALKSASRTFERCRKGLDGVAEKVDEVVRDYAMSGAAERENR